MAGEFAEFLVNPVVVATTGYSTNASADDLRTPTGGTAYMASVQQASAEVAAALEASGAVQAGRAAYTVYFDREPLDTSVSPAKRPGVRDTVTWTTASGESRTLVVLGPVRDEGGGGLAWSVDCAEVD